MNISNNELTRREFYFVRHGATDWNLEGRCMGQQDIPLSDIGTQQAHNVAEALKSIEFVTICHSPLKRAVETAKIIEQYYAAKLFEIDELKERYYATYEGMLRSAIQKDRKNRSTDYVPPDAEAAHNLQQRIIAGINQALIHSGPILIVSHGGVYKGLMEIMGFDRGSSLDNCAVVRFTPVLEGKWYKTKHV